jgi:hypothetical protein
MYKLEDQNKGSNWKKTRDCRGWNWLDQGPNWKKLKVWLSIKSPSAQIEN